MIFINFPYEIIALILQKLDNKSILNLLFVLENKININIIHSLLKNKEDYINFIHDYHLGYNYCHSLFYNNMYHNSKHCLKKSFNKKNIDQDFFYDTDQVILKLNLETFSEELNHIKNCNCDMNNCKDTSYILKNNDVFTFNNFEEIFNESFKLGVNNCMNSCNKELKILNYIKNDLNYINLKSSKDLFNNIFEKNIKRKKNKKKKNKNFKIKIKKNKINKYLFNDIVLN